MTWKLEVKSDFFGTWDYATAIQAHNTKGVPAKLSVVYTGLLTTIPGVFHCVVTGVSGSGITVTQTSIFPADIYNPNNGTAFYSFATSIADTSAMVGDEFDIGFGYRYNDSLKAWCPIRSFGILIPDMTGPTMSIRLTSLFTVPQVYCKFEWACSSTNKIFRARSGDDSGDWVAGSVGILYLTDEDGILGVVKPAESVVIDVSPHIDAGLSNADNPIILSTSVSSYSI